MRVSVDWRGSSNESYKDFCKKYPDIELPKEEWKDIIYSFNEAFRDYILETGEKIKYPSGFGEFSINKKRRNPKKIIGNKEYNNLPVDWKKTREKGKRIYHLNYHTEGYFFGWMWFRSSTGIKFSDLWYFKPSRVSSRLLAHYLKISDKYQNTYNQWKI